MVLVRGNLHVWSRREEHEITALAKKARSKGMPKLVIVRVPVERQSDPEAVEKGWSIDGTVERVAAFVRD